MFSPRRALPAIQRRPFVSTVLLSRTWDNETLVELRKEAKARGLSTKGNKSTLLARIRDDEENSATCTSPPIHPPATARNASTNATFPKRTAQAASPGIPLATQPDGTSTSSGFLAIKLPDLSQRPPNAPVQVVSFICFIPGSIASFISSIYIHTVKFGVSLQPYVPDFWNSARSKPDAPFVPKLPKVHVVSGSATHYDGGPTHILGKHQEDTPSTTAQANDALVSNEVGFWPDVWESLGLPRSFSARRSLSEARSLAAQAGKNAPQIHSRQLTNEERIGLYILLGIVGGSWLVGGLVNRPTAAAEH